ncbi:type II toxin-antitoxin system RelE/ParE family toxin [Sphingomonas sp. PP-CE-3G-477]|uniref:type II toxin-antitoxin system RelE/ParE family toxin n=1 Tax=Sphingomonas sp. PP-CE-3G-477 TaxID=2135660 RepID=UPI0035BE7C65
MNCTRRCRRRDEISLGVYRSIRRRSLKLIWRPKAVEDATTILDYIADRNRDAAERLSTSIAACADRLADHPFMYRPGRADGTREAVVHPNYLLIYRVVSGTIEIVNVVHARQNYP